MKSTYIEDRFSEPRVTQRYVMISGRGNGTWTYMHFRESVSQRAKEAGAKNQSFDFCPDPQQVRQLRKALQQREAELVAAGFLEEE